VIGSNGFSRLRGTVRGLVGFERGFIRVFLCGNLNIGCRTVGWHVNSNFHCLQ
jgi:hypothetical protein